MHYSTYVSFQVDKFNYLHPILDGRSRICYMHAVKIHVTVVIDSGHTYHKYTCTTVFVHKVNSPAVKKVCTPKKAIVKKDVKFKVATKKWLWWQTNGKIIFNENNSGEFVGSSITGT